MDASCNTYVVVLDTAPGFGGYYGVCGTSAASPMFAGIVAIADQFAGRDLGLINPALYKMATTNTLAAGTAYPGGPLFDVIKGDNVQAGSGIPGYQAGTGWDPVTGMGTPNGLSFVQQLVSLDQ
jgi:subtilase family serine protease